MANEELNDDKSAAPSSKPNKSTVRFATSFVRWDASTFNYKAMSDMG